MGKHPSEQLSVIFYRVNRAYQYLMSLHLKPFDITPEQWNVLKLLQEQDGISQKDLSFMADKDKTTITRILDSLEHRGSIRRQLNPSDRRSFLIFLTEAGMNLIRRLQPIPDEVNRQATAALSVHELEIMKDMLARLVEGIERETAVFGSHK